MQPLSPSGMIAVIDGKRYNTDTATRIADNAYWDGSNFDRGGRNTFLFRTAKGNYFTAHITRWQGEQDRIVPRSQEEAIDLWQGSLSNHHCTYEEAFPGAIVEEA